MKATGLVLEAEASVDIEPDEFYDLSRFGNNGVSTDITWVQLPSGLWVMSFNGVTSLVTITDDDSLKPTGGLTIMSWWQTNDVTVYQMVVGKGDLGAVGAGYVVRINAAAGLYAYAYDGAGNRALLNDAYTVVVGTWYFHALTLDGTDARLYRNVNEEATAGCVGITQKAVNLELGVSSGINPLNGLIALPKIYNYALSPTAIYKHFQAERSLFGV